jgi:hypothetical protein
MKNFLFCASKSVEEKTVKNVSSKILSRTKKYRTKPKKLHFLHLKQQKERNNFVLINEIKNM